MGYEYDIFVSYRRLGASRKWFEEIFWKMIQDIIALELGANPKYYIDSLIDVGSAWPLELGEALGKSKVVILLWTVTYMESDWCRCEVSHMLEREIKTGFKTINNNHGLIFPTIIHDGESMPVHLSITQKLEIQDYYVPFMDLNSSSAEKLYKVLIPYGSSIAKSIKKAPEWQPDWGIDAMNEFYNLFNQINSQKTYQQPRFINK